MSGNPLAMAAGVATLEAIQADPAFYDRLERLGAGLEQGLRAAIAETGAACTVARVGSMWTLFFSPAPVDDWSGAAACDTRRFARFFQAMLARGVYLAPSQFEANFVSAAHTGADIAFTIEAARGALEASGA